MTKIVLDTVESGFNLQKINANFQKIVDEFENKILYRDNPEGTPNSIENDIDLNGNSLLNIKDISITGDFFVDGTSIASTIGQAEQFAQDAAASATAAAISATSAEDSAASANEDAALLETYLPDILAVVDLEDEMLAVIANATNINTVSTNVSYVQTLGSDLAGTGWHYDLGSITDAATGEILTPDGYIKTVYNNLTDIIAVADNIAEIIAIGGSIADITTVAGIDTEITTVAEISANVTTVAGIASNVTTVAGNTTNINSVASNATNINTVATNISNVNAVASNTANVTTVANNSVAINTVAGIAASVTIVAGIYSAVSTVASISTSVSTVAGISSSVSTVAGISSAVVTTASDSADIQIVAANIATIAAKANAGVNSDITSLTGLLFLDCGSIV